MTQMEGKAMQFLKGMLRSRELLLFREWHSLVVDIKARAIEDKMLAQMEGMAMQFLKRMLSSKLNMKFQKWKEDLVNQKAEELRAQLMDSTAVAHLKVTLFHDTEY